LEGRTNLVIQRPTRQLLQETGILSDALFGFDVRELGLERFDRIWHLTVNGRRHDNRFDALDSSLVETDGQQSADRIAQEAEKFRAR
jgi:hypothetical protein